jgi:hypothetical protein
MCVHSLLAHYSCRTTQKSLGSTTDTFFLHNISKLNRFICYHFTTKHLSSLVINPNREMFIMIVAGLCMEHAEHNNFRAIAVWLSAKLQETYRRSVLNTTHVLHWSIKISVETFSKLHSGRAQKHMKGIRSLFDSDQNWKLLIFVNIYRIKFQETEFSCCFLTSGQTDAGKLIRTFFYGHDKETYYTCLVAI